MARLRISTAHRPIIALQLIVSLRFQVLFHSPHRGTFHLSLTVLVHYRLPNVFSLGEWTPQFPTGVSVLRRTQEHCKSLSNFAYGAVTLYGLTFQKILLSDSFLTLILQVLQPRYHIDNGLGCSPFARHYSGNNLFSSGY